MARIKSNGLLTGIIGNLEFANVKGLQVVKVCKRTNNNGKGTKKQELQRAKVRLANVFLHGLSPMIRIGYQKSPRWTPYNEIVSHLISDAMIITGDDLQLNYPLIKVSRGEITPPVITGCERTGNLLTVNWDSGIKNGISSRTDEVMIIIHTSAGVSVPYYSPAYRQDGRVTVRIPDDALGPIHAWMFYNNPRREQKESLSKVSNSLYLGHFEQPAL